MQKKNLRGFDASNILADEHMFLKAQEECLKIKKEYLECHSQTEFEMGLSFNLKFRKAIDFMYSVASQIIRVISNLDTEGYEIPQKFKELKEKMQTIYDARPNYR
jgi:Txe/YoeB family toxin of Txe-Axe toxin-antitoxin module